MKIKIGFTMAEALITIGIIGIVAAMTLPSLIQKHKRQTATARLKKFYSAMAQAILMAENDYGPASGWSKPTVQYDEDGNIDSEAQGEASWNFWIMYLAPYIKYLNAEKENSYVKVIFSDGSVMWMYSGTVMDLIFDVNGDGIPNENGKDRFDFFVRTSSASTAHFRGNKSFGAAYEGAYKTREKALTLCENSPSYCSLLLLYDNWEFMDDYPYNL